MKEITNKERSIVEQAVYGDLKGMREGKVYNIICMYPNLLILPTDNNFYDSTEFGIIKPIFRPMSLLTKEITHNGYNHNKPFIPIVDFLEKNNKPRKFEIQGGVIKCTNARHAVNDYEIDNGYLYTFIKVENDFITPVISDFQNQFIDYMNMLHFDWRGLINQGEALNTEKVGDFYK